MIAFAGTGVSHGRCRGEDLGARSAGVFSRHRPRTASPKEKHPAERSVAPHRVTEEKSPAPSSVGGEQQLGIRSRQTNFNQMHGSARVVVLEYRRFVFLPF